MKIDVQEEIDAEWGTLRKCYERTRARAQAAEQYLKEKKRVNL